MSKWARRGDQPGDDIKWEDLTPFQALIMRQRIVQAKMGDSRAWTAGDDEIWDSYIRAVCGCPKYEIAEDGTRTRTWVMNPMLVNYYAEYWREYFRKRGEYVPMYIESMTIAQPPGPGEE